MKLCKLKMFLFYKKYNFREYKDTKGKYRLILSLISLSLFGR